MRSKERHLTEISRRLALDQACPHLLDDEMLLEVTHMLVMHLSQRICGALALLLQGDDCRLVLALHLLQPFLELLTPRRERLRLPPLRRSLLLITYASLLTRTVEIYERKLFARLRDDSFLPLERQAALRG